jgi:surface protein
MLLPNLSGLRLLATGEAGVKRKREDPPPDLLSALDGDTLREVLSYTKGMSCKRIGRLCQLNRAFAAMCRSDAFWRWQCGLRDYDRVGRLDSATGGPRDGSWQGHYHWWCARQHTNETLKEAASEVKNMPGSTGYNHPFYGPIAEWDVSQVTSMSGLFAQEFRNFNGDLSRWDVSNVTSMKKMFLYARSFNSDLSGWNVSKVTNMKEMFYRATSFNADLSRWDVSNVTDMHEMFWAATSFNSDLSRWDVSKVADMTFMFSKAESFNGDLSRWDVSNVADMTFMFFKATSFNGDLSLWDVSNGTDTYEMFYGATSYNPPPGRGIGERNELREEDLMVG